jgi:ribose transport system ATP-binding protein
VPKILFGAASGAGSLQLDGAVLDLAKITPRRAMGMGIAFVPADRGTDAAIPGLSITDNVTMTTLHRHGGRVRLSRAGMHLAARELGVRYGIRPNMPRLPLGALSGGNQQRAVLAKWLQSRPALLLLAEPTQGVDIGAREHIFEAIRAAARNGAAVLCASADDDQLAAVCDRVIIVARGRAVRELTGADLAKERITEQVLTSVSADVVLEPEPGSARLAGGGADGAAARPAVHERQNGGRDHPGGAMEAPPR